ncbi:hypothetical protein Micbo1qcDRAFT_173941 [Microdochium bolleyi]|uniref:Uncharacterized protein n=1 Tax=Microdochium bolleyi TaxID=196109 RepID=A0A136J6H9_9PEZI|nr:hypothetical protein Micbo1qcDRAFT_173941 [Microdochium bolleyi]
MPRRPRSYIEPGVGKRLTRAARAIEEQAQQEHTQQPQEAAVSQQPQAAATQPAEIPATSSTGTATTTTQTNQTALSHHDTEQQRSRAESLLAPLAANEAKGDKNAVPSSSGGSLSPSVSGTTAASAAALIVGDDPTATQPKPTGKRKRSATVPNASKSIPIEQGHGQGDNTTDKKATETRRRKRPRTVTGEGSTIGLLTLLSAQGNGIASTVPAEAVKPETAASSSTNDQAKAGPGMPKASNTDKAAPRRAKRVTTVGFEPATTQSKAATDEKTSGTQQKRTRARDKELFPNRPPLSKKRSAEPERENPRNKRSKTAHSIMKLDSSRADPGLELLNSPWAPLQERATSNRGGVSVDASIHADEPAHHVYFFAYGRLMREDFMLQDYPDAVPVGIGKIKGWRFCLAGPRREGIEAPSEDQVSSEGYPTIVSCQADLSLTSLAKHSSHDDDTSNDTMSMMQTTTAHSPGLGRTATLPSDTRNADSGVTTLPTPSVYGRLYLLPQVTYNHVVHDHLSLYHASTALTLRDTVELLEPVEYDSYGNEVDSTGTDVGRDPQLAHLSLPLRTAEVVGEVKMLYLPAEKYHMPSRCVSQAAMAAGYDIMIAADDDEKQALCADIHWQTLLLRDHERALMHPVLRVDIQQRWAANGLEPKPELSAGKMLVDLRPQLEATRRIFGDRKSLAAVRRRMAINTRIAEHEKRIIAERRRRDRTLKMLRIKAKGKGKKSGSKGQKAQRDFVNGAVGRTVLETADMERKVRLEEEGEEHPETELQPRLSFIAPLEPRHVSPVMYGGLQQIPLYEGNSFSAASSSSTPSISDEDDVEEQPNHTQKPNNSTTAATGTRVQRLDRITNDQQKAHAAYMSSLHDAVVDAKIEGLVPAWYIHEELRAWVPHPGDIAKQRNRYSLW